MNSIYSISNAFSAGGIWMWAILVVQIISIAIIIERVVQLYVLRKPSQKKLVKGFENAIKQGELQAVVDKTSRFNMLNPVALVTNAGAQAAIDMGGREEIQARMDEVLLNENEKLNTRTGFLAMLGNVGTLLGLLGTIVGLIQAFASISNNTDPNLKSTMLTEGIAMAMNTTAYGLIMAIPALIMFAVLQNRSNKLSDDLNQASLRVFNWLSFNYDYKPKRTVRRRSTRV